MGTGETDEERVGALYAYNCLGWITEVRKPMAMGDDGAKYALTQFRYDAAGNPVQEKRFLEYQTETSASGRVHTISYQYDAENRLTHVSDCTGAALEYRYDRQGRCIQEKRKISDTLSQVTGSRYDSAGRLVEQTRTADREGCGRQSVSVKYEYDRNGNITRIFLPSGGEVRREYDDADRLVAERHLDKKGGIDNTTRFSYDRTGSLACITDNRGRETRMGYDLLGRETSRRERDGGVTRRFYDRNGNLAKVILPMEYRRAGDMGAGTLYAYDAMDRPVAVTRADGTLQEGSAYDLNGNLTRQTDVTGKTTEYRYDLVDQVCEVWDNGKRVAGYGYNPDGTVRSLSCGGLYTEYGYDMDRNLASLRTTLGKEVLADNRYRYDGNGRRVEKRQIQGLTSYAYDSMNRLSVVEYPRRREELFYDRAGNRTRRVCGGEEELYRYDSRNRLTEHTKRGVTREYKYDNAGNLLEDGRARYEYDAFNRNTKAETPDGNVQVNHYDAEGLRHEMEENGKLVSFIFRGREVVTEESQGDRIRYIRTGELLASGAEYARTYYHYASDEMGSITHVVAGEGEEPAESGKVPGGKVLNHYEYDAWGNLTACEETVPNRFRFNGQQYDPITQQYYLRARYYNPVIGRFTQEDTYRGDGLNLYTYCRNNPVSYADPSGHMTCPEAREEMRRAIAAGQDITRMDSATASQLREWAQYKSEHGGLTRKERRLARQIGLDIEGGSDVTRRQAFREAKEAAGIPKSAEFNTHRVVFD